MSAAPVAVIVLGGRDSVRVPAFRDALDMGRGRVALAIASVQTAPAWTLARLEEGRTGLFRLPMPPAIRFDYAGWDTVSEFVSTRRAIVRSGARVLYVVTDPGQMRRALAIARELYVGTGIRVQPWLAPVDGVLPEPLRAVYRDQARAATVRITGAIASLWGAPGWLPHSRRVRLERRPGIRDAFTDALMLVAEGRLASWQVTGGPGA